MMFFPTFKSWCYGSQYAWEGKVLAAPAANDEMDMGYTKPDGYWDINAPIIEGWDY